ncbi:MAG: extracellular solute-binding protein [Chloroflexi bacterium AL-W]|nr:extracellular solute-binding protein [Chloroflexi bacterium AL-N1]NOK64689.1 extracellular solute-binding protein [Chloroflexi bacterium AL-N10]NOK75930.1 extracellular solute-binding protein [Chloroflexi bacterium AL-N5]NOK80311.1 extracellular solute-binding protein [Chloroflexi bacterium AL-W]NOK86824.1 extracellular solute-binding protein [Chloroflexi bacterium AL-N15]
MQRLLKLIGVIAILTLFLAACGQTGTTTEEEAPAGDTAAEGEATEGEAAEGEATEGEDTTATEGAVSGDITLWHAYGSGGAEEKVLGQLIENAQAEFPDANITVLAIPFDQLFNKFETEAATGGGPDVFVAPNDSLVRQVEAGLLMPLDDMLAGQLDSASPVAIEGSTVNGELYAVPQSLKAVGLFYNKEAVETPPTTTDELLEAVQNGATLGLNQNAYHSFGFFVGFGGELMNEEGVCIADQGGFTEAMEYLVELKEAGAQFFTDGGAAANAFQTGDLDMLVDGPWNTGNFAETLSDNLGVAPVPAGPAGPAGPLTGVDGFYINVSAQNPEGAVALAQFLTNPDSMQLYIDEAGHVPTDSTLEISDEVTQGFADSALNGYPRPQKIELDNFWTAFDNMVSQVMEGQATPADAVAEACSTMNQANGK